MMTTAAHDRRWTAVRDGRVRYRTSAFIVGAELCVIAALGWLPTVTPLGIAISGATVVFAVVVLVRPDGTNRLDRFVRQWRLRLRQRSNVPFGFGLVVTEVVGPDGPIGMGRDGRGWFTMVEVAPPVALSGERSAAIDLARLAELVVHHPPPASTVQVVLHTVPPLAEPPGRVPFVDSYLELSGPAPRPSHQTLWLATHLRVDDLTEPANVARATIAASAWATRAARRVGASGRALSRAEMVSALSRSWAVDEQPGAREGWSGWQTGGLVHVSYEVRQWPAGPFALADLARTRALFTSVAVVLRPQGDNIHVRGFVRLAAEPEHVRGAAGQLVTSAARPGLRLRRLDGEHALGAYATAPTGGGAL